MAPPTEAEVREWLDREVSYRAPDSEPDFEQLLAEAYLAQREALEKIAGYGTDPNSGDSNAKTMIARAALSAAPLEDKPKCYCGSLEWTVRKHGRITHKHSCPARPEPYCQAHPDGVGCSAAPLDDKPRPKPIPPSPPARQNDWGDWELIDPAAPLEDRP